MARTTTTALLRTFASREDAIKKEQDKVVDRDWMLSDKSAEALSWYTTYYQERADAAGSVSEQISFSNKITTATRSSFSAQIQQRAIDVLEGNATTYDKYATIINLYNQAADNGDYDLALNLRQQANTAWNTYVTEQEALSTGYGGGGYGSSSGTDDAMKQYVQSIKDYAADVKSGMAAVYDANGNQMVKGDGTPFTLNDVSDILATVGEKGFQDAAREMRLETALSPTAFFNGMLQSQVSSIESALETVTDEVERAKLVKTLEDLKFKNKYDFGGVELTADELQQAYTNELGGNPMYTFSLQNGQYKPVKNAVTDVALWRNPVTEKMESNYVYGTSNSIKAQYGYEEKEDLLYYVDEAGSMRVVDKTLEDGQKAYEQYQSNKGQGYPWQKGYGTKESAGKAVMTYDELLSSMGIRKGAGGMLELSPDLQERFARLGFTDATINESSLTIDPRTALPEFRMPDGRAFGMYYDATNDIFSPVEQKPMTADQFLGANKTAPSTTQILGGVNMMRDLQTNIRGAALQGANTAKIVQGQTQAGTTTGVLQNAANAQALNTMITNEKLRVVEQQRLQNLAVQPVIQPKLGPAAPVPTVGIFNPDVNGQRQVWSGVQVQPRVIPKFNGVTTAPSTSMTSGGSKLQGGSGSIQGSTTRLQGGTSIQGGGLKINTTVAPTLKAR